MDKLRAALYIRVSTEEQAMEGYSLQAQEEKLVMYCEDVAEDLSVYKVYRDEGYSGRTTRRPGYTEMMAEMGGGGRQVISITHLPQIAALGTTHYKVFKEETPQGTISHMQLLSDDERISEIAQMLSGSNVTDAAIRNARELLSH